MAEQQYRTLTISPIRLSKHAIRVTISHPPINLIDATLLTDIHTFLTSLSSSPNPPKLIVFSSADPEIWLSHLDLHLISAKYPPPRETTDPKTTLHLLNATLKLLNTLPIISVAEVNGLAVGGGNEIALNMDLRYAGPNARFGIPEVAGGVLHGGGLSRLSQLIGPARAIEWSISARGIGAVEAERVGWVNRGFGGKEEMREWVDGFAERVAGFPRGGIEGTKGSVWGGEGRGEGMARLMGLVGTEEAQRGVEGFIDRGGQERSGFELGLPESAGRVDGENR